MKKIKCILFYFMVIEIGYDVLNFILKSDMFYRIDEKLKN